MDISKEAITKRFEEEFDESLFDLHYRFCPLIDIDDESKRKQNLCKENKDNLQNQIISFLLSERALLIEEVKKMVEGMKKDEHASHDYLKKVGYNTALKNVSSSLK